MAARSATRKPKGKRRAVMPVPRAPVPSIGGFVVREPFAGAWQRNIEQRGSSALSFSAVYGCVNVISSDIGKLPIEVYREELDGGRTLLPKHPASILFYKPNAYQTWLDHIQQVMASVLLAGNGYALFERDQRGVVSAMHPLNPAYVTPLVNDADGSVFYQLTRSSSTALLGPLTEASLSENLWVVPARAIFHHRVMTVDHPLVGVTPLFAAGASASIGANATTGSAEFLSKIARPSGVLTAPGKIDPALAEKLKKDWAENYSGINAGMPAVLGGGLEWKPLTVSAVDLQVIELLRFSVEDVGRVYRVPPFMLGELGKASYRNSEQMMRAYYSGCLSYHLTSLEQRYDRALDLAGDVYCKFNLDDLLRSEMDVRFEAYQKALASGWIAINEVRRKEGYAKTEGGDEPFVQMQYVPLSIAAEGPPEPPAPAPAPALEPPAPDGDPPDGEGDPPKTPPEPAKGAPGYSGGSDLPIAASEPDLAGARGDPGPDERHDDGPADERPLDRPSRDIDVTRLASTDTELPIEPTGRIAGVPLAGHRGVWADLEIYGAGDLVTHDGSTWIANEGSSGIKPGTDPAWRLVVKRGADGKNGRAGLGFGWRGAFRPGTTYHKNDVVRAHGAIWTALRGTDAEPPARGDEGGGWSVMMRGSP